jgi:hypothetical protein
MSPQSCGQWTMSSRDRVDANLRSEPRLGSQPAIQLNLHLTFILNSFDAGKRRLP